MYLKLDLNQLQEAEPDEFLVHPIPGEVVFVFLFRKEVQSELRTLFTYDRPPRFNTLVGYALSDHEASLVCHGVSVVSPGLNICIPYKLYDNVDHTYIYIIIINILNRGRLAPGPGHNTIKTLIKKLHYRYLTI